MSRICFCKMESFVGLWLAAVFHLSGIFEISSQEFSVFDKQGRCASVAVTCSRPNANSRCFFHMECPGGQLCCSVDGCVNNCVDPVATVSSNATIPMEGNITSSNALTSDRFTCRTGLSISSIYRCNGRHDCPGKDNSDEVDCPCTDTQTLCPNGLCMDTVTLCHPGGTHSSICPLRNLDCKSVSCVTPNSFRCENGQCITAQERCDGSFNCLDGSDEEKCVCSSGKFSCDGGLCKSALNVWCNGVSDCLDRADEPENCTCIFGQFTCSNGRCVPQYQRCDLRDDCLDGSDESNCFIGTGPQPTRSSYTDDPLTTGITPHCDGSNVRFDGTYESSKCDARRSTAAGISCQRRDHFSCGDLSPSICFPMTAWCDKIADCPDRSDEVANCSFTCPGNAFRCDSSRCISMEHKCDGEADCLDNSDEKDCACEEGEMPLPTSACLKHQKFCDGKADVGNGADEEQCTCKDRIARTMPEKLCDGVVDCPDSSDEMSCGNCTTAQFYCIKSQRCIFRNQTCDGYVDCKLFGEDEENCLGLVPQPCQIETDTPVRQERTGCLAVNNRGEWTPVCAERWSSSLSDAICEIMGYDKSSLTNLIPMDPSEMPDHSPDQRGPRQFRGPQIVISGSRNCPSRKKVYIECGNLICGQGPLENVPPRSLSGDAVPNGKHSWTAALYAEGQFFCSAVLIDQEWVLTAANCVNGLQNTYMVARAGITRKGSMNQNEQFLPIDYMVLHPNYRASSNQQILSVDGDLALLHLSVPAHWNAYVKPVCLATSSPPAKIFIAGWGRVLGSKVYSTGNNLREMLVYVMNSSVCSKNSLVEGGVASSNMFCGDFSSVPSGDCVMDRGAAALTKDFFGRWGVVGIASFSLGCNIPEAVSAFVGVAGYVQWIADVMAAGTYSNKTDVTHKSCVGGIHCELGTCISPSQICDGTVDCPLASDELNCIPARSTSQSGSCEFSDATLCGYKQDLRDQLNWYRGNSADGGNFLGRNFTESKAYFIYIGSLMKNAYSGSIARLISPKIGTSTLPRCLEITFRTTNGMLVVYDYADSNDVFNVHQESRVNITSGEWLNRKVDLPSGISIFVVEGRITGNSSDSVVALTSILVQNGLCNSTVGN